MINKKIVSILSLSLLFAIISGCGAGNVSAPTNGTGSNAQLVSISVTPTDPTIAVNTDQPFTATGIYSDNSTQDLTAYATWSSSDTSVASISSTAPDTTAAPSNSGRHAYAYGKSAGKTTITAKWGGYSGSTDLTVTNAILVSLAITPANPSLAKGTTRQLTATGTFSDNTTQNLTTSVTWGSSNTGVATMSSSGLAAAVAAGTITVSASSGSISDSTSLTVTSATLVSIAVTPSNPSISQGTKQQFTATGTFSDNSTQILTTTVTWNSSNPGAASISNAAGSQGLATAIAAGSSTITAASGGVSGTATLVVTPITATGSATLGWAAPTTNTDGTPLTDLAGYKIYYGTSSRNYTKIVNIGNVTTYTINNLSSGTYFFAVTSYDSQQIESGYSSEVTKTIQ